SEQVFLPVSATGGDNGSLSAQDLDGDGDTDLLWQGSLRPHVVIVWSNNGAGWFECLCPLESRDRGSALGDPGVSGAHRHPPDSARSAERTPPFREVLTARWNFHVATTYGSHSPEPVWSVPYRKRFLSTRSPQPLCS